MISFLIDGIATIGAWIAYGVESSVELILTALGLALAVLFGLLPSLLAPPSLDVGSWLGWLNWFIPVAAILDTLFAVLGVFLLAMVIRWGLRYMRAL